MLCGDTVIAAALSLIQFERSTDMHQFSPVSERMQLMHQKVRDRVMRYGSEHARIATEFVQAHESMVPYLRRPMILKCPLRKYDRPRRGLGDDRRK